MISKHFRLPARQIKKVFRSGQRCQGQYLQTFILSRKTGASRFAFIVSTKIEKKAVGRNKMKRICKSVILENFPHKPIDVIILTKKNFLENGETAREELKKCLPK